ncbi:MAG TPA: RHS repeat-associated core domain-containing protein [Longimicrobium sp.]|jgi:RHS repeat-associated protein
MARPPYRRWPTAGLLLLAALAGAATRAQAQGLPIISFHPDGRTFYGPHQQVQVHICDEGSVRDASTRVWLNGTQLSITSTAGDASCPVHRVVTLNLTFASGTNTLEARACQTIAPETCVNESATYTFTTPDPVKPSAQIATAAGTFTSPTLPVAVNWCDDYRLNSSSPQFWLNDTAVSIASTTANASGENCYASATSSAVLTLQPGANQFKAVVRDSAGNVADTARATFTYTPAVSRVGEDRVRRPGLCAVSCFEATLGYSSPAYTSLDTQRSFSLLYSSAHAQPRGMVEVDVAVGAGPVPTKIGLRLLNAAGAAVPLFGTSTQTVAYYSGSTGTNRVSAWFNADSLATGTYRYTAEVLRHYGSTLSTDTMMVRVIVVNEADSRFGVGWSIAGEQKIAIPSGAMDPAGVTLVDGTGNAVFFSAPSTCGSSGACTYLSPPSEFNTLVRTSDRYALLSPAGDSAVFTLAGKIARTVDRFGNTSTYYYYDVTCAWCSPGNFGNVQDPAGKYFALAYNEGNGAYTVHLASGAGQFSVVLDANRDVVGIYDADGVLALAPTYSGHRLTGYTDRAGNRTDLTYDAWGKVASVIGPAFRAQGSTAWRDTTHFVSHERGVLPGTGLGTFSSPAGSVSPDTLFARVVNSRGQATRLRLDGWRAANLVRDPLGYVSASARNADALVTAVQDAKGNSTSLDWSGRLLSQVIGPAGTVQYEYDGSGRLKREFGDTPETQYFYSAGTAWVVDSVNTAGVGTTRFTHDTRGRMLTQTDAGGHVTTAEYDVSSGWMNTLKVIAPGARTTTWAGWDSFGRATRVTTADGQTRKVTFDVLGRVTTSTAPDSGVVRYFYGLTQLDSLKDARNQVFRWTRNQLGWVETEVRPDDGTQHRTAVYDRYGRVVSATDRRSPAQTVSYGYDAYDRVTTLAAGSDTTFWSYSSDQPGVANAPAWLSVRNAVSADSMHYDALGRLSRTATLRTLPGVGQQKYEIAYTYNALGGVDSLKYQVNGGGWKVSQYVQSNSTGLLTSVRDFSGRYTNLSYNGEGNLQQVTFGSGQVGTLSYTSTHQLSRIGYSGSGLNSAAGLRFTYDGGNRLVQQSDDAALRFRDFGYDDAGRLEWHTDRQRSTSHAGCQLEVDVGWVCSDDQQWTTTAQRAYTYDPTGNPTDRGALIGLNNRLNGYDGWTLTYDNEGNLTGKSKPGQPTYAYGWNALGQLTSVTVNGTLAATYAYDGMGRRVYRIGSAGAQWYVHNGDHLLLAVGSTGVVSDEYTYFPGIDQPLGVRRGTAQYYFATDANGNVLALTDSAGTVKNQYRYSPYGVAELVSETVANPLRYAAREWDADAGLYFNRARWYDPQFQRFVSQDPIGIEGGLNLYAYADNDPVNANDPSGLVVCVDLGRLRWGVDLGHMQWGMPVTGYCQRLALWGAMRKRAVDAQGCESWMCPPDGLQALCEEWRTAVALQCPEIDGGHPLRDRVIYELLSNDLTVQSRCVVQTIGIPDLLSLAGAYQVPKSLFDAPVVGRIGPNSAGASETTTLANGLLHRWGNAVFGRRVRFPGGGKAFGSRSPWTAISRANARVLARGFLALDAALVGACQADATR